MFASKIPTFHKPVCKIVVSYINLYSYYIEYDNSLICIVCFRIAVKFPRTRQGFLMSTQLLKTLPNYDHIPRDLYTCKYHAYFPAHVVL